MYRILFQGLTAFCLTLSASSQEVPPREALREGFVHTGHIHLHYRVEGEGDPILLLHGGFLDLHAWDKEVSWLSQSHTVVRIDLPGHGRTTGSDTSILIADVLHRLLDSLGFRKVSIMGLSLGGSCSVELALAYPASVDKLILVSPGLSGWMQVMKMDDLSTRLLANADSIFRSKQHDAIAETFTNLWCDGPYRSPGDLPSLIREYVLNSVKDNLAVGDRSWPTFNPDKAAVHLEQIDRPTLILTGDRDLPFIDSAGEYYRSHIPNARLVSIPGTAHMINLEKPDRFKTLLAGFLEGNFSNK